MNKTESKKIRLKKSELPYREKILNYLGKDVHYTGTLCNCFVITWMDLITPRDVLDLLDDDYNAFGVFLPKRIILEVLDFHKNNSDEFSNLIKEYPFIQLIFSQWLTIKLYKKHKELVKNPKLEYKSFMREHFCFTYYGKTLNIYEAIEKMKIQEFNNKTNESYNIISPLTALSEWKAITLYDFIYDIIPNSIKRVFLKDEAKMKAYLPLKQESFEYREIQYAKSIKIFKNIYGDNETFNKDKIKKEWHTLHALALKGYKSFSFIDYYNKIELLVPKAKQNKLGMGYDELFELIAINEKDLEYPNIWDFKEAEAPDLTKYYYDEEEKKYYPDGMTYYRVFLDKQRKATWRDIVWLCSFDYLNHYGYGYPQATEFIMDENTKITANKQHFIANALIMQNNFNIQGSLFENFRQEIKKAKERLQKEEIDEWEFERDFDVTGLFRSAWFKSWYGFILEQDAFLAFRFNQALTLSFLNAYDGK